jgi:hypothetical protein
MDRAHMESFEGLFRSLETEMRREFAEVKAQITQMNTRMAQMSDRIDRIVGALTKRLSTL